MKVCGFTFVRNAVRYDYPVVESIRSILPVCDEVVVAVGDSTDDTLELVNSIGSPKVRIIRTVWDEALREGGRVLAVETDKALDAVATDADWALYIQADEVLHEDGHAALLASMQRWKDGPEVEGLLFDYRHFYASYGLVGDSRRWYRREVRAVRPGIGIRSWRDAQGFRKNGRPLQVRLANAVMHHYGWVKPPEKQQAKQRSFNKLWHDDAWVDEHHNANTVAFDYSGIDSVAPFTGKHPAPMQTRVDRMDWHVHVDPDRKHLSLKNRFLQALERLTGWRVGEYRNYRLLR